MAYRRLRSPFGKRPRAKGRPPTKLKSEMNGLESRYALLLEAQKRNGLILDYKYQPEKFKLAKGAYFTPDFMVLDKDGLVEVHEVKGHWEEAARVRIKVAAELHTWFLFRAVTPVKGQPGRWKVEDFGPEEVDAA